MSTSLREKFEQADTEVRSLESDAASKWSEFESAKTAFATSDASPTDTTSDAFRQVDEAGKAHDAIADRLNNAKVAREAIGQMLAKERGAGHRDQGTGAPAGGGVPAELRDRASEVGIRIAESDEYRSAVQSGIFASEGKIGRVALGKAWEREELKTLLTSASGSAGAFIAPDRSGGFYPTINRPLTLLELITLGQTDSNLVQYVKQTLATNNAGAQATEGGAKPESAYAFSLVDEGVKTLAHWVPAVKQALEDAGQLRTIIDGALRAGLDDATMAQIVSGSGASGNIKGILNQTGIAAPAPKAADGKLERIHRGITAVRLANMEPTAVGLHPLDWEDLRLRRDASGASANTGQFLMGSPLESALNLTVWGLTPAVSTAIPQGTALVGDWRQAILWLRSGVQVLASDSHLDYFTHNMVAVLAEFRAAFGVPRPDAFAAVDLAAAGS